MKELVILHYLNAVQDNKTITSFQNFRYLYKDIFNLCAFTYNRLSGFMEFSSLELCRLSLGFGTAFEN